MYSHFRKLDWPLIISALLLSGVGLFAIYGIGSPESMFFLKKQAVFLALSFIAMAALSFFDYRVFKNYSFVLIIFYVISLASLFFVLFSSQVRGAASWFRFGLFNVEPIEFFKVVIVLLLAKYFSHRHIEMYRIRHLIVSGLYVGVPMILVLLQPDFGSALVLFCIWLGIVLMSGIKMRHLLVLVLATSLLSAFAWFSFLQDYQKDRIVNFLNPEQDPYGGGYHVAQSLIAVGSGGMFGRGLEANSQAGLKFLPEQHTDFIFAAWAEQRGLVGVAALIALYMFLFWRIIKAALSAQNNFSRLFSTGLVMILFSHVLINIGMNMALLPVTGLTLPLVSYGGSSMLSIYLALGILQSIKARS